MDKESWKEIASQLRQPQGTKGIEMAEMMNETNIKMTSHSIDRLDIQENDNILELGHGNCGHLEYLLNQRAKLTYHGLETSNLMKEEAHTRNKAFVDKKLASFHFYDGLHIPFPDNYFDKIFTVNTIYFWAEPKLLFAELHRVIKPEGLLNITYAEEKFMKQLPFTEFGFNFYDNNKIKQLMITTTFKVIASNTQTEFVKSKTGDLVNREFRTTTIKKEK